MSNVDTVREGFRAFAATDLGGIRGVMSPDVVWHVPGRGSLAGQYRGTDAVLGYFGQLFERSAGTFRAELLECGEIARDVVACTVRISGQLDGGALDQQVMQRYRCTDGRIAEVRSFSADQYALDEADGQSPVAVVRRGYDAFARGDLDALRRLMHPDVTWNEAGRNALAGTHRGIDAVLGMFAQLHALSGGSFTADVVGCAEIAPGLVAALAHDTATMPGGAIDVTNVHVFRVEDGRVVEVTAHPSDAHAVDAAIGTSITLPGARTDAERTSPVRA